MPVYLSPILVPVARLLKKNKMLAGEIGNHEPRVSAVVENGQKLVSKGHPQAEQFNHSLDDLVDRWHALKVILPVGRWWLENKILILRHIYKMCFSFF